MHYTASLIKDRVRSGNLEAINALTEDAPRLEDEGLAIFGIFSPLFGLASNEFYVVTFAETPHSIEEHLVRQNLELLEQHDFEPTARPERDEPCSKPGVYVFRWFLVKNEDIDEIVRLSVEAWVTFEGGFETEVQALFKGDGRMLLITQYTDLSVWEASRSPDPRAVENFRARTALTLEARPIATRLVTRPA